MLLHPYLHSSRRLIVTIACILFHQVEGFPVLVKKARAVLGPPPLPILKNSNASWFDDSAAMSTLVTRSSDDVVHDSVFIPTIATMGVLVIICIFCVYNLIINRHTVHSRSAYIENGPIFSPQYAVGHVESGHRSRPLSRISKTTRSIPSTPASVPASPSVGSNMLDRLQRRREEEHLRQLRPQDPYEQYMSANQNYPQQQQHYQYAHPSLPGHRVEAVQPQLPHSAHVPTAQPQHWDSRQSLQQSDLRRGVPQSPAAQTPTPSNSDVLSYATPPEARRAQLPSTSRPQTQDYFNNQHQGGSIPLQTQPSTQGDIAHSVPSNYTTRRPPPSATTTSSTTNSTPTTLIPGFTNQPPGYSTSEMLGNDVRGSVASSTFPPEKHKS